MKMGYHDAISSTQVGGQPIYCLCAVRARRTATISGYSVHPPLNTELRQLLCWYFENALPGIPTWSARQQNHW